MFKNSTKSFKLALNIYIAVVSSLMVSSAMASTSTGIKGKYKVVETHCSSGAPIQSSAPPGEENLSSSDLTFTSDEITEAIHAFYKIDSVEASRRLQQIKLQIETLQSLPDGPYKEDMLKSTRDLENVTQSMISGLSCTTSVTVSYAVEDSEVQGKLVGNFKGFKSDCPMGLSTPLAPSLRSSFKFSGNALTLTDDTMAYAYCPQGDSLVWTLEKAN